VPSNNSSNDSSALVTSADGHGSGRCGDGVRGGRYGGCGDGGRGDRDGGRGGGRGGGHGGCSDDHGLRQRCSYCGINGHTENYCWGNMDMHIKCMMKICNSPLLQLDMMLSVLLQLQTPIPPLHLSRSSRS